MESYLLLAMTNSADGQDETYNHWFDTVHLPEILQVEGIESAHRYELAEAQRMAGPLPYRYATIYAIQSGDLPATLAALGTAVARGTKTDSGDPNRRALWVYAPRGGKRR
jgi:hypothetical protein